MDNLVEESKCRIHSRPSDICNRWALLFLQAKKSLSFFISKSQLSLDYGQFISELHDLVLSLDSRTLPSPAMWKIASVENTIRWRAFWRQPISLVHTMTCIIASSPPSGPSRLPDTGAACTWSYLLRLLVFNRLFKNNYYEIVKNNVPKWNSIGNMRCIHYILSFERNWNLFVTFIILN